MYKAVILVLALASATYALMTLSAAVVVKSDPAFSNKTILGNLKLHQVIPNGAVIITGTIRGLTANATYGVHIHEKGDLSQGCKAASAFFNPDEYTADQDSALFRRAGDLGSIRADSNGEAQVNIPDELATLCGGPYNIMGRTLVVRSHSNDADQACGIVAQA